jgi:hypothetical protein
VAAVSVDDVFAFDRTRRRSLDSSDRAVSVAREVLAASAGRRRIRIGGGTRANFTELNRLRPNAASLDLVTYTVNPQIHAFDEESIVETLPVLPMTVGDARRLVPRPISIVVSLRPRFNAVVRGAPDDPLLPDRARADVRQDSAFTAAWLLGAIARLSMRGVASITVAETHGAAGLIDMSSGASRITMAGALVASLTPSSGGSVVAVRAPDTVAALAIETASERTVWLANLTSKARDVAVASPLQSTGWTTLTTGAVDRPNAAWRLRQGTTRAGVFRLRPWEIARLIQR